MVAPSPQPQAADALFQPLHRPVIREVAAEAGMKEVEAEVERACVRLRADPRLSGLVGPGTRPLVSADGLEEVAHADVQGKTSKSTVLRRHLRHPEAADDRRGAGRYYQECRQRRL